MSTGPNPQEIEQFLKTVADLLKQPYSGPDFSDLFSREGSPVPGEIGLATPEEIETALVIGLQKAEIARRQAVEEKRVSEQWSVVEGVAQRNDEPPSAPTNEELQLVDQRTLPDVSELSSAAEKAFQELSAARGEADDVFEQATAKVLLALDQRDAAIARQHEAVAGERKRRQQAFTSTREKFDQVWNQISTTAKRILDDEKNFKSKGVKNLRAAVAAAKQELTKVELLLDKNSPDAFDSAVEGAVVKFNDVASKSKPVESLAKTEDIEDRRTLIGQLPKDPPVVAERDLSLEVSDQKPTYELAVSKWRESVKSLTKVTSSATDEEFERAFQDVVEKYESAQDAADSIQNAATEERQRRELIVEELRNDRLKVTDPDNLKEGTEEHASYRDLNKKWSESLRVVGQLTAKGPASEFEKARQTASNAIQELATASPIASEKARQRAEATVNLKNEAQTYARDQSLAVAGDLASCPIPSLVAAVKDVFKEAMNGRFKQIKGIDSKNDERMVAEIKAISDHAQKLSSALSSIDDSQYQYVQNNVEITSGVQALLDAIKSPGFGNAATQIANVLAGDVGKIADRYDRIATIRIRYAEAVRDRNIEPPSQLVLRRFPDLEKNKDDLKKGELTERTNEMLGAIIKIEDRIAKNADDAQSQQERENHRNSESYALMSMMLKPQGQDPVAKLEALINGNEAQRGDITDAYRSSYDHPDKFSVEVEVLIQNYKDVVVHAHCNNDGTAKPGNACHIKVWRYRFDPGGFKLSNALRNSLLPSNTDCRNKARNKGLVV